VPFEVGARHDLALAEQVLDHGGARPSGVGGPVEGLDHAVLGRRARSGSAVLTRRWSGVVGHRRPRQPGTGQQVTLHQVDLGVAEHLQFLGGLDALGDDAGPDLRGEGGHGTHQRTAIAVSVEVPHQLTVELQEVGRELDHVPQARVAGAGVVDGDPHPPGQPGRQVAA